MAHQRTVLGVHCRYGRWDNVQHAVVGRQECEQSQNDPSILVHSDCGRPGSAEACPLGGHARVALLRRALHGAVRGTRCKALPCTAGKE